MGCSSTGTKGGKGFNKLSVIKFNNTTAGLVCSFDINFYLSISHKKSFEEISNLLQDVLLMQCEKEIFGISNYSFFKHFITFDNYKEISTLDNILLDFNYIKKANISVYEQLENDFNTNSANCITLIENVLDNTKQDIMVGLTEDVNEQKKKYCMEKIEPLINKYSSKIKQLHLGLCQAETKKDNFLNFTKTIVQAVCTNVEFLLLMLKAKEILNIFKKNNFQFSSLKVLYLDNYEGIGEDMDLLVNFINQCKKLEILVINNRTNVQNIITLLSKITVNPNLKVHILFFMPMPNDFLNQSKLIKATIKFPVYIKIKYNILLTAYTIQSSMDTLKSVLNNFNDFISRFENYYIETAFTVEVSALVVIPGQIITDEQANSIKNEVKEIETSYKKKNKTDPVFQEMIKYANTDKQYKLRDIECGQAHMSVLNKQSEMDKLMNSKDFENCKVLSFMKDYSNQNGKWDVNLNPLKSKITKMKSLNTILITLENDIAEDLIKKFTEFIPYLNKVDVLISISITFYSLKENIWNFTKELLTKLKNVYSFQLDFYHAAGSLEYKDAKEFIPKICQLKKDKLLGDLYSINIKYTQFKQDFKMDDFKLYLSELLLGYPKITFNS